MMTAVWRTIAVFLAGVALGAVSVIQVIPNGLAGGGGSAGQDPELSQALSDLGITDDGTAGGTGVEADGSGGGGSSVAVGPEGSGGTGGTTGTGSAGDSGTTSTGGSDGTTDGTGGSSGDGGSGSGDNDDSGSDDQQSQGVACEAGRNGGATDTGVSGDSIFMATTTVDNGIGAAFLRDVKFAIEAVKQKVNQQGGICGRRLDIEYRDDGWDAATGAQYLRNFIDQGVFAIPVGPSTEGLNVVINSGDFNQNKVAVVGTDGLTVSQYQCTPEQANAIGCSVGTAQQWVWPVAAATVSSARIMATAQHEAIKAAKQNEANCDEEDEEYDGHEACNPVAADFSVVFDKNYKFGEEGALAYDAQVEKLTGDHVPGFNENLNCREAFCGIVAGSDDYTTQVDIWRDHRGRATALFLEPATAERWMNNSNTPAASQHRYDAAQPLFSVDFAELCKGKCHQMLMWTGFVPNREGYRSDPDVQQYIDDVHSVNPNVDVENQFVVGGYVGAKLLVEALREAGPTLTRDRFKQALDGLRLATGLTMTDTLAFSPDNRYVAIRMQAWVNKYSGQHAGWSEGPLVTDPRPQAGIG